jgi:hypothetical protein
VWNELLFNAISRRVVLILTDSKRPAGGNRSLVLSRHNSGFARLCDTAIVGRVPPIDEINEMSLGMTYKDITQLSNLFRGIGSRIPWQRSLIANTEWAMDLRTSH